MTRLEKLLALVQTAEEEIRTLEPTTHQQILRSVARRHRVPLQRILGPDRHRDVVYARQEAAWRLRNLGLSYPKIGQVLNRDHTTIMYAVRQHETRRREAARKAA